MSRLEVACFNTASALTAQKAGADRIEFCHGYAIGGITPDYVIVRSLRPDIRIPLYVMIRPRGGDFYNSEAEFEEMKVSVKQFTQIADGFVFGILKSDKTVDVKRNSVLVDIAAPKPCTFHRAFDAVQDIHQALEDVIACGFDNILTSGGCHNALIGIEHIAALIRQAGTRIVIMPGGSVRSSNIRSLQQKAPAKFFHSAAVTVGGDEADPSEIALMKSQLNEADEKRG